MIITGMEEGCSVFTKTNKYLMMSDWHAVFAGPRREQMRSQQDHKLICVYLCWCICVSRLTSACALCTPAYLNMCAFTCMFSLRRWKCVCVYAWPSSLSDHKGPKLMMIDLSEWWFFFMLTALRGDPNVTPLWMLSVLLGDSSVGHSFWKVSETHNTANEIGQTSMIMLTPNHKASWSRV